MSQVFASMVKRCSYLSDHVSRYTECKVNVKVNIIVNVKVGKSE